ncbi:MAG TPA: CaiB/BaiF CoA-transferase family protein [Acidimicrobiales bacterium]|nr:CaiB/BaiF CoA-transferase family protein [Acidimicrobiales bacterium]
MAGPLSGVKVIELAGIGPSPYACMLLADAGADVLRLERPAGEPSDAPGWDLLTRSRPSVGVDLKHPDAVALVLDLVASADVLIEGMRPGVTERLGLGPDACWQRNPRLVYGRMTGWGQDGPLADVVGHDIDYIAVSGTLWAIGRAGERPVPPLNLVGDFGGGGMLLAFGVVAALVEARSSGTGQVVDAAMTDGSASLMTMAHAFLAAGVSTESRGTNLLDTGAHFYEVYETSDGRFVAVGAIEPRFYAALLTGLGLDPAELPSQMDRASWPKMKERLAARFATKTRDEWAAHFEGTEACVAPVLSPSEAMDHPHNVARGTFVEVGGVRQPGPAPRFSRSRSSIASPPEPPGGSTTTALRRWGVDAARIDALLAAGALGGR